VAVRLSTPNGMPKLAHLGPEKIVHVVGEGSEPGFVLVMFENGQTYQVFLEDLQERGECIID
jgi:hypothetical protein